MKVAFEVPEWASVNIAEKTIASGKMKAEPKVFKAFHLVQAVFLTGHLTIKIRGLKASKFLSSCQYFHLKKKKEM